VAHNKGNRIVEYKRLEDFTRMNKRGGQGTDGHFIDANNPILGIEHKHDEAFSVSIKKPFLEDVVSVPRRTELWALFKLD
jgi:hypothetical protein